jgi:hypothetical protein
MGVSDPEAVPDSDLNRLETTTPQDGFSGIVSRSRFMSPGVPIEVGHGTQQVAVQPGTDYADPAEGRPGSFHVVQTIVDVARQVNARLRVSGLGVDDRVLEDRGRLQYVRRRDPIYLAGLKAADLPRWTDAGPVPRATVWRRYTMRREFEQDAQTFTGAHTVLLPADKRPGSKARHRMGPPHTNRLTYRDEPASFGSKTKSLNG